MRKTINEWLKKAQGDYLSAEYLLSVENDTVYDAVVFHSQQAIEKLIKAVLIKMDVRPPKIHDLIELCDLLTTVVPNWTASSGDLRKLNKGATEFRYPGDSADLEEAKESFEICKKLREQLLQLLSQDS